MVEFRGIVLKETSAKQQKIAAIKNIKMDVTFDKLRAKKNILFTDFTYKVSYEPKVGFLTFKGTVSFTDKPVKLKSYISSWKKTKLFPDAVLVPLMNLISVTCGSNGVLVTRTINLAPPMRAMIFDSKNVKRKSKKRK